MRDRKYKLKYDEWEQLDKLLRRFGFGGYYDMLEVIKCAADDVAAHLGIDHEIRNKFMAEQDLRIVVDYLSRLARRL